MTRMFCPVRHVTAPVGRQTTLFGRDRQVAAPGAKSAVSDCILFSSTGPRGYETLGVCAPFIPQALHFYKYEISGRVQYIELLAVL